MMIYGQFNVFQRDRGLQILKNAYQALKPGGILLMEVQSLEQIQKGGEAGPSWYSASSGLFSAGPHLVLQENFWDQDAKASTSRFSVIDAETARVSTWALSNEAYTERELEDALESAGFAGIERFPSLTGDLVEDAPDLPVYTVRKE
jgi:hypothetical protein